MEEANDNVTIDKLLSLKGKKNKKTKTKVNIEGKKVGVNSSANNGGGAFTSSNNARVSLFDSSFENFFRDMDTIAKLCREEERNAALEQSEIQRISSSVTFLREWRDFKYPSRSIRFAYGDGSSECFETNDVSDINLPQFSSATVPKHDLQKDEAEQLGDAKSQESRDFVMNVGGSVWAIDWCPRIHEEPDCCSIKCEFLAVAAHPPGSSYHKMGPLLTGRGAVQIWCLLNIREPEKEVSSLTKKIKKIPKKDGDANDESTKRPRGRPRKNPTVIAVDDENDESIKVKRPRGRPRKNPTVVAVDDTNCETQFMPPLAVQFAENSIKFPAPNANIENTDEMSPVTNKRKREPKNNEAINKKSAPITKPRGRPRKSLKEVSASDPNCENQFVPLAVEFPDVAHGNCDENTSQQYSDTKGKHDKGIASACNSETLVTESRLKIDHRLGRYDQDMSQPLLIQCGSETNHQPNGSSELEPPADTHGKRDENALRQYSDTKGKHIKRAASSCNSETLVTESGLKVDYKEGRCDHDASQQLLIQCGGEINHQPHGSSGSEPPADTCSIPGDIALPRVVSCLAHNGKVAWDVKWQPINTSHSSCKHRLGYLAVLLGNGSLEVWEVPLPQVLRAIYMHSEGTDPRFIKLEPVFKCSVLKCGSSHSIPLTVEWSVTPPHDYLLAGCHDGTVALWKFSTKSSAKCDDTNPVLCFRGDTAPIRTVAWAPFEGDPESSNIIVTAGHEGLKFWDLRNPFRPLRNLHPTQRIIYSLSWLSKPSCIIMSCEDGTMKTISLVKAASEQLPGNGKVDTGKKQPWLHSCMHSSFAIWSVQISRITGMVAYCGVDGTAVRFKLTKAVVNGNSHNRIPNFLCGSLSEEDSIIIVNTPVSNSRLELKKSQEKGPQVQSFRNLVSMANLGKSVNNQLANQGKSVNNQMAKASNDDDPRSLALFDGDNLGMEYGSEEPKIPRPISSSKKKAVERAALPGVDNEKSDFGSIPEVLPPKVVALHSVRWNMNKGSERWLCFGGASGLVRCQEIVFSNSDMKYALKS